MNRRKKDHPFHSIHTKKVSTQNPFISRNTAAQWDNARGAEREIRENHAREKDREQLSCKSASASFIRRPRDSYLHGNMCAPGSLALDAKSPPPRDDDERCLPAPGEVLSYPRCFYLYFLRRAYVVCGGSVSGSREQWNCAGWWSLFVI